MSGPCAAQEIDTASIRRHGAAWGWLGALIGLAILIWLHDLAWVATCDDALPALVALPMAWWLGRPWQLRSQPMRRPLAGQAPTIVALAALVTSLGAAAGSTLLLATAWTAFAAVWLATWVAWSDERPWTRLAPLAICGFPWLLGEGARIGWVFRLTGAAAAEATLAALRFDVVRWGTELHLGATCVSVSEACSGLHGLQTLLLAGTALAWTRLRTERHYWWHVPLLAAAAWLANFSRILVTAWGATTLSPAWVSGTAHLWQGSLLVGLAFLACLSVYPWLRESGG